MADAMWKFRTLADFWRLAGWLESRRQRGLDKQAMETCLVNMTGRIRAGIDEYERAALRLDACSGGCLSHPQSARRAEVSLPHGMTVLAFLQHMGGKLRKWFDGLAAKSGGEFMAEWFRTLDQQARYASLLNNLVQQFGNFETVSMTLPGSDDLTISKPVQQCLQQMFEINTRSIRMIELARSVRKAWQQGQPHGSTGFFNTRTDLALTTRAMVMEYMIEADPVRIQMHKEQARGAGKPYAHYRFWRAAETVRQLGQVAYGDPPQRHPVQRRRYVDLDVRPSPHVCTDSLRLEWAFKEILNNALGATSSMFMTVNGVVVEPLARHAGDNPNPAIRLGVKTMNAWLGWRKREIIRLTISDEGAGIAPDILEKIHYWGFSFRKPRVSVLAEAPGKKADSQEITIGGKGIGVPFAMNVFREHGGRMKIHSVPDQGTTITIDLPIKPPFCN
ncbi:MAG: sensor histidine kinase [Planctomycetes bacterium]|nr:sensor histidine kinase [Planctomycetota bacterium]